MSKKKYLIETSAVSVAINQSTPNHYQAFREAVSDGELWTSVYIRMEFVRRWIKYFFRLATTLQHFRNIPDALRHENQSFSIRDVKAINELIASLVEKQGTLSVDATADEIVRVAIWKLRKFDRLFQKKTNNACGCQIGGKKLHVDFNTLWDDVRSFIKATGNVDDCPINHFLDFRPLSDATTLVSGAAAAETSAVKALLEVRRKETKVDCKRCKRLGDAVIALDQPRSWTLVHIDEAFDAICAALEKKHKRVASQRSAESDVPRLLEP
jgi:hypothetical protein